MIDNTDEVFRITYNYYIDSDHDPAYNEAIVGQREVTHITDQTTNENCYIIHYDSGNQRKVFNPNIVDIRKIVTN